MLRWIQGVSVGQMEEEAIKLRRYLEDNVMSMTLCGGVLGECDKNFAASIESLINCPYGEMVYEIDYAMGVREKNRIMIARSATG